MYFYKCIKKEEIKINIIKGKKFLQSLKIFIIVILLTSNVTYCIFSKSINENNAYEKVDEFLNERINELRIPGSSLGIVKDDKISYLKSYGISSKDNPITENTPFVLGSVSKSITATAIMQLVEKNKIDLDATVVNYIPWFKLSDEKLSSKIRVRDLLNHTSGIPSSSTCGYYSREDLTIEDFVRSLKDVKLLDGVGSKFEYSDANYSILGLIIEKVSNMSYENYIKENIFKPLDMTNSYTSKMEALNKNLSQSYRTWFGYSLSFDLKYPKHFLPSALIISTSKDMCKFLSMHLNNGIYNGKQLLSKKSIDEMRRPVGSIYHSGSTLCYGMGFYMKENSTVLEHPGYITGFSSYMTIIPETKTAIILLYNANNQLITKEYLMEVAPGVKDILEGKTPTLRDFGFRKLYTFYNLIFASLFLLIVSIFLYTLISWNKKVKKLSKTKIFLQTSFDYLLSILLFISFILLLKMFNTNLSDALLVQPDLSYPVVALASISLLTGIYKTVFIIKSKKVNNVVYK